MSKKKIVIITGTGGPLGTGHLQRMLTLAAEIDRRGEFNLSILTNNKELIPSHFRSRAVTSLPERCSLIIKDRRDSSETEMLELKAKAPVIAVDDTGPGRSRADYILDLLPNPENRLSPQFQREDFFLYGYNFTRDITAAVNKTVEKFIDITIYTGADPSPQTGEYLKKIIPGNTDTVRLTGNCPQNFLTGKPVYNNLNYAEILLSSKILITYFGITLFEGCLCGCSLFTVNPSEYHRTLTSMVSSSMNIIDSEDLSVKDAEAHLKKTINECGITIPSEQTITSSITCGPENFYTLIKSII